MGSPVEADEYLPKDSGVIEKELVAEHVDCVGQQSRGLAKIVQGKLGTRADRKLHLSDVPRHAVIVQMVDLRGCS